MSFKRPGRLPYVKAPRGAQGGRFNLKPDNKGVGQAVPRRLQSSPAMAAVDASITGAGDIVSAEALGQPGVMSAVAAAGIPSGAAVGSAAVQAKVSAAGVPSAEAIGQPAVGIAVAGTGIAGAEALGQPAVTAAGPAQNIADAGGIGSAEAIGQPQVSACVAGTGIASADAVGAPELSGPFMAAEIPPPVEEVEPSPQIGGAGASGRRAAPKPRTAAQNRAAAFIRQQNEFAIRMVCELAAAGAFQ